jgi:hypothetical protein
MKVQYWSTSPSYVRVDQLLVDQGHDFCEVRQANTTNSAEAAHSEVSQTLLRQGHTQEHVPSVLQARPLAH